MCKKKDSKWGNLAVEWSAIPEHEFLEAQSLLKQRCRDLFGDRIESDPVVQSGIEQRLHQARRTWRGTQSAKPREYPCSICGSHSSHFRFRGKS
jgi:hypothetical protein